MLKMQDYRFVAAARSIRNALDPARLRQANRLFEAGGLVDAAVLSTISEADIRPGRIFSGGQDIDGRREGKDQP